MNAFEIIIQKIIKDQEQLIGPLAWFEASKVKGLKIIDQKNGVIAVEPNVDSRIVINGLVSRYGNLFGKAVTEFLPSTSTEESRKVPKLKFTLRISALIEEYLHFKTHNTKVSKADYLRGQIEKQMETDVDWQQYLDRHHS